MQRTTSWKLWLVVLVVTAGVARGDSWSFPREITTDEYSYGDVRIIRTRDARSNEQYPEWAIHIYRGSELRALYRGVSFEVLAASDNNRVFVGISNSGLPDTAIIVFDADGNLRLLQRHVPNTFDYCQESITLVREWYDEEQPDLRFDYDDDGDFRSISVRGCKGERIDLMSLLSDREGGASQ